jgi:16S rRNA (uracil1498-N3)-methyltransferase
VPVTAPLYLVEPGRLDDVEPGAVLALAGDEGRHAATVRRTRRGERLDVADGAGRVARCVVAEAGSGRLEVLVEAVEDVASPRPRLVLVQALAKAGRDELAVELATEVGIDEVVPWQAARSIVVWSGQRGRRGRDRWSSTVREAAKQSRRPRLPTVAEPCDTAALCARVAGLTAADGLALILDGAAEEPLSRLVVPPGVEQILLLVGPEGGIDQREQAALVAAGARAVRLGPTVLRTSTAGAAATVVLSVRLGRW